MAPPSLMARLLPGDLTDPEERRVAVSILTVLGPGGILLLLFAVLQPFLTDGGLILGVFYAAMAMALLIAVVLVNRGKTRLAGPVTVAFLWVILTVMASLNEGVRSPTVVGYPVLVAAAAYYWNSRAAMRVVLASVLAMLGMALAQMYGVLPDVLPSVTPLRAWGGVTVATLMSGVIMRATSTNIQKALGVAEASERKFRDLIQSAPDGMAVLDGEGRIVEVNRRMVSLFRATRAELLDVRGDTLIPGLAGILRSRPEGLPRAGAKRTDGSGFPAQVSFNSVVFDGGEATVLTVRDISDEVRLEDERSQVEARLRDAQKMEAVGQLAGGIAHDFNNLLTVILGNVSLELERADLPEEERKRWGEVEDAAARAAELTNQLLAFSRRQAADPRPLELSAFLQEKGQVLQRILGERVRLLFSARSRVWAEVDPGQMDHVILAIVRNARDAMPKGGTLRITCEARSVGPTAEGEGEMPPGEYACVCFRDTGAGMDEEALARAFEPFFTTKGFGGGMGLGLATVHGIVTQSGGHVLANSTPGLGSTVCLYFPRIPEPAESS